MQNKETIQAILKSNSIEKELAKISTNSQQFAEIGHVNETNLVGSCCKKNIRVRRHEDKRIRIVKELLTTYLKCTKNGNSDEKYGLGFY
ncbi:16052_t:CDS:2 [Gigaspora margarita]|uniref:16052_t:CDS:1 n=1 Tax=Gigaspora margarita TaxID=4874 RepID=A0ABN7UK39_GIGMA|nr:16052_t:CDS:2 [Gigaspora margarita]